MPAKKRQNDPETGKKNKKEKRDELASDDLRERKEHHISQIRCARVHVSFCVKVSVVVLLTDIFFVSGCQRCCRWIWRRLSIYPVQSTSIQVNHLTTSRPVTGEQTRGCCAAGVLSVGFLMSLAALCADVLLCHDDELEGRRVAFILYLVPPWEVKDGGTLDLFSTDEHCQPVSVVKSLLPCWNSLVFFEVSPVSFHQVAEVLSEEKCRLSLSGWFHGPSLPRPSRYIEPPVPRHTHIPKDESLLFEWVNEMYLDPRYQARVQQEFEESSEICLPSFLQEEKLRQVRSALQSSEIQWEQKGPPNKRCYGCVDMQSVPSCVQECWELLSSESFFILLSNLTGLRLHYLCGDEDESENEDGKSETENGGGEGNTQASASSTDAGASSTEKKDKGPPTCVGELRRWTHGDYTLLHDSVKREYALDLQLHMGCAGWKSEFGGFTSYIAHDEDEELLTVYPEDNSLALVYRDKDTLKFIKHINNSSSSQLSSQNTPAFYDFSFNYYE
uniref:2-oxoglutarate and iron-dependent oxygenase domain containing 1 n=1 Tax=Cyprinus carpio TaxID=7962 RepID=A0A8C2EJK2_CYPCA